MFEKDLLVLEDFDPCKNVDDYKFADIPIWVRVFKLPLGMMSRATAEEIGGRIGEFLKVEGVENGLAMGQFLKIQVRMKISEPLMRGTVVEVDEGGRTIWCPFVYEYLPDFCYICGRIGHIDRDCSTRLKKGEEPQFGCWLKWVPPKKFSGGEGRRRWTEESGRRGFSSGRGGRGSGSDGPSWRLNTVQSENVQKGGGTGKKALTILGSEKGEEPACEGEVRVNDGAISKENLLVADAVSGGDENVDKEVLLQKGVSVADAQADLMIVGEAGLADVHAGSGGGSEPVHEGKKKGASKRYKKVSRTRGSESMSKTLPLDKKRRGDDMEIEETIENKKKKMDVQASFNGEEVCFNTEAGLSEQSCETQ
jgi:hypothetical protein